MKNTLLYFSLFLCILGLSACSTTNWQTANRESANLAPMPNDLNESIYQIYAARAFSWRGYFGTHPWISWKEKQDTEYTVAQVTSWSLRRGGDALVVEKDIPDRHWFGNKPTIIFEARGEKADRLIAKAKQLIADYPYKKSYRLWPGPNSNTFVEHVIRYSPELTVELPPHAIGKDYLTNSNIFALSPSGSGAQVSLFGLLGVTVGLGEGVEVNILSMTFGLDILRPALKLPFFGRLGFDDKPL